MWRALTQLPSLVSELLLLTREQNALFRELIACLSGSAARTPLTPSQPHRLVQEIRSRLDASMDPPPPRKIYTDRDVSFHTREDDLRQQEIDHQRRVATHKSDPPLSSRPTPPGRRASVVAPPVPPSDGDPIGSR